MRSRHLVLAALFGVLPTTLVAQEAELRIEQAMAQAQAAGIPVALLESKIAEGKAKGVPMERIAQAVERRTSGLARARAAIAARGGEPTADETAVGADALQSGVNETVLAAISETAPQERRTVAIAVLTELVARGHVPEEALARVEAALTRGPEALAAVSAEAAAEARTRRGPPAGFGNRPAGIGGGPPAFIPAPGQRPSVGRPDGIGGPPGSGGPPSGGE